MTRPEDRLLNSQKKLTLLLGGLAIALPDLLYLGNLWIFGVESRLPALSSYYYSGMRDVFVGILFSMGMFLITYEGYDQTDQLLASLAGIFGFVVALVPTHQPGTKPGLASDIHNYAATAFYLILTIFCTFRFTKTNGETTKRKKIRNIIYYVCGSIMALALISLIIITLTKFRPFHNPMFWLEYIANTAFGIAFLIKGEGVFFLNDDPIKQMNSWEWYGLGLLFVLIFGNLIVFTNIFFI